MTEQEQIFAYKELRNNGQAFFIDNYEDADRILKHLRSRFRKNRNAMRISSFIVRVAE